MTSTGEKNPQPLLVFSLHSYSAQALCSVRDNNHVSLQLQLTTSSFYQSIFSTTATIGSHVVFKAFNFLHFVSLLQMGFCLHPRSLYTAYGSSLLHLASSLPTVMLPMDSFMAFGFFIAFVFYCLRVTLLPIHVFTLLAAFICCLYMFFYVACRFSLLPSSYSLCVSSSAYGSCYLRVTLSSTYFLLLSTLFLL